MDLWSPNIFLPTFDVYRFSFELAGALVIVNEYSGLAVAPAHLYCFRRSQASMPLRFNSSRRRSVMKSPTNESFTAFVGIDWADKKHFDSESKPNGTHLGLAFSGTST